MATELANWLRAAGLRVEEVAGWQDRGHGELRDDVANMVVVNHHTAGGPVGRAPSLSTVLYGVPGVPGPLANVMQTREDDGNDVFMVIAAGTSYNAGTGGYAGVSGNFSTIGIECEHTGIVPYPDDRATLTQRFDAAVLKGFGHPNGSRSCQHFEWSDTGKIDIGTPEVDAGAWRARTTGFMQGGGAPTPPTTTAGASEDMIGLKKKPNTPNHDAFLVSGGVILRQFLGDIVNWGYVNTQRDAVAYAAATGDHPIIFNDIEWALIEARTTATTK